MDLPTFCEWVTADKKLQECTCARAPYGDGDCPNRPKLPTRPADIDEGALEKAASAGRRYRRAIGLESRPVPEPLAETRLIAETIIRAYLDALPKPEPAGEPFGYVWPTMRGEEIVFSKTSPGDFAFPVYRHPPAPAGDGSCCDGYEGMIHVLQQVVGDKDAERARLRDTLSAIRTMTTDVRIIHMIDRALQGGADDA